MCLWHRKYNMVPLWTNQIQSVIWILTAMHFNENLHLFIIRMLAQPYKQCVCDHIKCALFTNPDAEAEQAEVLEGQICLIAKIWPEEVDTHTTLTYRSKGTCRVHFIGRLVASNGLWVVFWSVIFSHKCSDLRLDTRVQARYGNSGSCLLHCTLELCRTWSEIASLFLHYLLEMWSTIDWFWRNSTPTQFELLRIGRSRALGSLQWV